MIAAIDHVVLTTRDEQQCVAFYVGVLGMQLERYGEGRIALRFGNQKLNVHQPGVMARLKAETPLPGALDLCFLAAVSIEAVMQRLRAHNVPIIEGPVLRSGGAGPIRSVYVRDPDRNLIEIAAPAQ
jgi:catechol 2,3-dioxygenase-like lactoylglutathione lyase family enzyme